METAFVMARVSNFNRLCSTVGVLLHILFVAIPKDIWGYLNQRRKSVNGQTIVITGGASGIGKALAEKFGIEYGANVIIIDINEDGIRDTIESIKNQNGKASAWCCDISKENDLKQCSIDILKQFGRVDILICNAAVLFFGRALELSYSQFEKSISVNLIGTINTIRAFLHPMEISNSGHIVAISSIAGYCGETNGIAYCPTKFAMRGVMECLEMEMRDRGLHGIRFTTICPYFTRTPMILNAGMRPTSMWFPFMSISRCSREVVDAILREKTVAFVPGYMNLLILMKNILPKHVQLAGRDYLNFRCTSEELDENNDEICVLKRNDFFHAPDSWWTFSMTTALSLVPFVLYFRSFASGTYFSLILATLFCNGISSILTLYICDNLCFSHFCGFKWFFQTIIFGLPSLLLLIRHKIKNF